MASQTRDRPRGEDSYFTPISGRSANHSPDRARSAATRRVISSPVDGWV